MNAFIAVMVINVAIRAAVAVATCYIAGSAWPLLGLVFLMQTEIKSVK